MGGIKRIEQSNSRLTELCCQSVIYFSGRTQGSIFLSRFADSVIIIGNFDSFDELLSSLEITNSKFSSSEFLITSEIVEHQTLSVQ